MDIEKLREEIAWEILYKMVTISHHRMDIEQLIYEYADQILAKFLPLIEQVKEKGMKEVVEFVEKFCGKELPYWQAKLKEWGGDRVVIPHQPE